MDGFKCSIFGDGPLTTELNELIDNLQINDYIELVGFVSHNKLISHYQNGEVDLVVLPSIDTKDGEKEGIPVSLIEAMAHGIPVISTSIGGIPELLSGDCGWIVPPANSSELSNAIETIMNDKTLQLKLIQNGYRKISDEFDIAKNSQKLIRLINLNDS